MGIISCVARTKQPDPNQMQGVQFEIQDKKNDG
jgi:hypothetical protein